MRTAIDNQALLALLFGFVGEYRTEEPCAYYEVIVVLHNDITY